MWNLVASLCKCHVAKQHMIVAETAITKVHSGWNMLAFIRKISEYGHFFECYFSECLCCSRGTFVCPTWRCSSIISCRMWPSVALSRELPTSCSVSRNTWVMQLWKYGSLHLSWGESWGEPRFYFKCSFTVSRACLNFEFVPYEINSQLQKSVKFLWLERTGLDQLCKTIVHVFICTWYLNLQGTC